MPRPRYQVSRHYHTPFGHHAQHPHHITEGHKATSSSSHSAAKMTPAQLKASRHEAAEKRIATMRARGEKIGWQRLTEAQRSIYSKEAAATRRKEGIKPFGGYTWATYDKSLTAA